MQIEIQIPDPHCDSQRKIMEAFLTPNLLEIVVACGTKYGKTLSGSGCVVAAAPLRKQGLYRWIGPIYSQSKIGFKYMRRMLPPEPWVKPNKSDLTLNFTSIDTNIQFFHGQNAESIEGEASHGNVIDEAAKQKYDVYASVKTTTTQTLAPILMMSTPKGKNWFYDKFIEAKTEMERAAFEGRPPRMLYIHAPTSDNPFVPREAIEFARKTLPDRLFRQYYLAEFIDDGSIFLKVRDCVNTEPIIFTPGERHTWYAPTADDCDVVIGADWGRSDDYTVFFAADVKTSKVVGFDRFTRLPYTEAIRRLMIFARNFKSHMMILHDKTGVGNAIDDMLAHTGLTYMGVTFTNASKAEMVTNAMSVFETKSIGIPHYSVLLDEIDAYEVKTNKLGLMSYSAPIGKHDDCVSALILMIAGLLQYGFRESQVIFLDDLPKIKVEPTPLEKYYQSIGDEDDE